MNILTSIAKKYTFKKGENIFLHGHKAQNVYQVIAGKVDLYRYSTGGQRIVLHRAIAGDFFAEASLNSDQYHCTATCIEDSSVYSYESGEILKALYSNTDFSIAWINRLSSEVRRQRACVERLHLKSPAERLTHYIDTEGNTDGVVKVDGTLSDLAESLSMSRETLYRVLSDMEKKGIIERGRDYLKLLHLV